ncbi:hypothetical protein V8C42DRAFT_177633 [Trichoderma barbatum]
MTSLKRTSTYGTEPRPNGNRNTDTNADTDTIMTTAAETDANTKLKKDMETDASITIPSTVSKRLTANRGVMANIWKHTIIGPSRLPGVHIFTLENARPRTLNPFLPRWMPLGPPRVAPKDGGYGWYFRAAHTVAPSWDAHNPSTYLVDSALWITCKESRNAMLKAYNLEHWDQLRRASRHVSDDEMKQINMKELPAIAHFRDRGKSRYFSLFPNMDLFYLQPEKLPYANWDWAMPLGQDLWTLCWLPHIALELNPA